MKLYLSSFRLGAQPEEILNPNAMNNRVAVIQNAQDCWTDATMRKAVLDEEFKGMESLGLVPEEFDLRNYFGRSEEMREKLAGFAYCWVCGGNSFVLRRAFHLSGLDVLLSELAEQEGGMVYGGYSAGACVVTPTLDGIHLADDPDSKPKDYGNEVIWDGVGIYPYCIAPHFRSDHPETDRIEKVVAYFIEKKLPFIALHDGEALLYDTITKQSKALPDNVANSPRES